MHHYDSRSFQGAEPISGFKASKSYADAQFIRRAINKAALPANRRDALRHLVNLWYYHRNGTGEIHPGAETLAKKWRVSLRTVKTILKEFREAGFISAIKYAKGGKNSTRYTVDLDRIIETLAPSKVVTLPGELAPIQSYEGPAEDTGVVYDDHGLPVLSETEICPLDLLKIGSFDFRDYLYEKSIHNKQLASYTAKSNRANFAHGNIRSVKLDFSHPREGNISFHRDRASIVSEGYAHA